MTAAARLQTSAQPAVQADPRRWFIIATNTKQERLARFHLERQGFEVYLPMRVVKIVAPTRHVGSLPLFPRYLFLRVNPAQAPWWAIRSTVGVKALISTGDHPAPLPLGFIDTIKGHEVDGLVSLKRLIPEEKGLDVEVGQAVVVDVAGSPFDAIVEEKLDANRVRLLLACVGGGMPKRVIARRAQLQSLEPGRQT